MMPIRRTLLPALALALVTCVAEPTTAPHADGTLSLPVHLALIEGAADATALPINQIRAVVRGVSGREAGTVLLDTRLTVDPSATSWEIDIDVPLTGASAEVVVQLSLINRAADGTERVEFSGITPPITVRAGASVEPADVDLVRGPLANLYVTGVRMVDPPVLMLVGQTSTLEAAVTSSEQQQPSVLWVSLDPLVATVVGAELTALTPGTARVVAVAGAFSDTTTVTVEAVPGDLAVFKTVSATEVLEGGTVDFLVTVVNGGAEQVDGVRVTENLPPGMVLDSFEVTSGTLDPQAQPLQWTLDPLPPAAAATLSLTVSVGTGTVGTTLTNTAEIVLPAGYEDPNPDNNFAQASVSVIPPFTGGDVTVTTSDPVGAGLQALYTARLSDANHGGTTVTVTSLDPAVALVSPTPEDIGAASFSSAIPDSREFAFFYVHGLENVTGTAPVVVEAAGFTPDTVAASIVQPILTLIGLNPNPTWLSGVNPVQAYVGTESSDVIQPQTVRAGAQPLTVTLSTSDPSILIPTLLLSSGASVTADILPGTFNTPVGLDSDGFAVNPVEPGTAQVAVAAPGYRGYNDIQFVEVLNPEVTLISAGSYPAGMQSLAQIFLGTSSAHGGSTFTLTSSDPQSVLFAPDSLSLGSGTLDVFVPDGEVVAPVWIQAAPSAQPGIVSVTANEPRFTPAAIDVPVAAPVVALDGLQTTYAAGQANVPFRAGVGYSAAGIFVPSMVNALSGTVVVEVQTTNPEVVAIVDTQNPPPGARLVSVPISVGDMYSADLLAEGGVELAIVGQGTATVSVSVTGFGVIAGVSDITITVSP